MAWDPLTGQWSPDVSRQPLGALGSVMNYLNARRATVISDEIQKNRAAQARQAEASAAGTEFETQQEKAAAEAIALLGDKASLDDINRIYAQKVPSKSMALGRAAMSADARLAAAEAAANARRYETDTKYGNTGAPVPTAQAHNLNASGDLKQIQGEDIEATRQSRINALNATAESRRINAQLRGAQRRGMKLSPDSLTKISKQISSNQMLINELQNQKDAFGFPKRPTGDDLMLINNLESENIELNDYREDMKGELGKMGFGRAGPTAAAPGGAAGTGKTDQQLAEEYMANQTP